MTKSLEVQKGVVDLIYRSGYTKSDRYECLEDLKGDSVELYLIYCGWEVCDPGYRFGPNRRTTYVLHFVKEGRGTLEIDGKVYNLVPGDAFLIQPEVEAWYEADVEDPWTYLWVGFSGFKSEELVASAGFSSRSPVHKLQCVEKLEYYINEMLEAHQLSHQDELRRNGLLMLVFSELIRDYRQNAQGAKLTYEYPGSVYVKHAVEYIAYNYNKKIKINELADYIGVNRSYLTSCFKKTMGCSPQTYLINLRMEKAKSMLKKTNMQINVIANAVGYQDQLAFSKIFKQYYGVSPKAYRESEQELLIGVDKGIYPERDI